jgi:hypothetical protein
VDQTSSTNPVLKPEILKCGLFPNRLPALKISAASMREALKYSDFGLMPSIVRLVRM